MKIEDNTVPAVFGAIFFLPTYTLEDKGPF